ncbi:MAG: HAD family phosphatase [Ruminococcaceae bacterium]|nr:HAD family phosphatase [Oscillospiraceae bacterium]
MHYIFDFDGTLVDSMPIWANTHIKALTEHCIACPENFVETITPLGNIKAAEYALSLGVKATLEEHVNKINTYLYEQYTTIVPLKETVKETLSALKNQGHRLHVLTASPHLYVDACLKRLGVFEIFENVWTIEDFGCTKSETIIYEKTAERLNAKLSECIFVDDNFTAISTSKKAGMKTVAVYEKLSENYEDKLKATADNYVYRFSEML